MIHCMQPRPEFRCPLNDDQLALNHAVFLNEVQQSAYVSVDVAIATLVTLTRLAETCVLNANQPKQSHH